MEAGQLLVGRSEAVRLRVAHARHHVPVVAGPARQRERGPGRDHVEAALRVEHVAQRDQVVLVGAAAVVEHQQPLGVAFRRPLLEAEWAHRAVDHRNTGRLSVKVASTQTTSPALEVFVRLVRAHAAVTRQLSAELQQEHGLTINAYEALLHLARAEDQPMRRVDLANSLLLTASGVTRLLDGLERSGLIARQVCPSDARASYSVLTDAGQGQAEQGLPVAHRRRSSAARGALRGRGAGPAGRHARPVAGRGPRLRRRRLLARTDPA